MSGGNGEQQGGQRDRQDHAGHVLHDGAPITPLSTQLADAIEANAWAREVRNAVEDGAHWGWLLAVVAAAAVWVSRGMPAPLAAAVAVGAAVVGMAAAAGRTLHNTASSATPPERRYWAWQTARGWLTFYALVAAIVPPVMAGAWLPVVTAVVAVLWLAVLTIPMRARWRLLARLRIGAAAVAGTAGSRSDEASGPQGGSSGVRVGRVAWSADGRIQRVHIVYPVTWPAQRDARRDDLAARVTWELLGPPPANPDQAKWRPDYVLTWNHVHHRLQVERMPPLPDMLPARDWGKLPGLVLGQTIPELADVTIDDGAGGPLPLALWKPNAHALVVGSTQHGKSSGVRAWATDGLKRGLFPGGMWALDGKGSGSLAPLMNRRDVHAIGHNPDEWRKILTEMVGPAVSRRYEEMLAYRSGERKQKPEHKRALCILDESQQILLDCKDLEPVLNTLARQALEANVILWVITQRPDASDAVPGAIRDQLVERVTFGPLSTSGAKMTFDVAAGEWHRAMGVAPIAGRALTWIGGQWRPVQAPWLPMPADEPDVESLYPRRMQSLGGAGNRRKPPGRKNPKWPPEPPTEPPTNQPPNDDDPPDPPDDNSPDAGPNKPPPNGPGPNTGRPVWPYAGPKTTPYDPNNPYGRRRK